MAYSQLRRTERATWDLDFLGAGLFFGYLDALEAWRPELTDHPELHTLVRRLEHPRTGPGTFCAWLQTSRLGTRLRTALEAADRNGARLRAANPAARHFLANRLGLEVDREASERAIANLCSAMARELRRTGRLHGLPVPPSMGGPAPVTAKLSDARPPPRTSSTLIDTVLNATQPRGGAHAPLATAPGGPLQTRLPTHAGGART